MKKISLHGVKLLNLELKHNEILLNMIKTKGALYLRFENEELRWLESEEEHKTEDGKYVGQIENGEPCGHGTFTYPNGEKYVGEWKNGKRHGDGKYTDSDGRKYEGEWSDGAGDGQRCRYAQ